MTTIERNEMFELAFRFVTETSENIFLTGKAGTGKTTFLKYLKEHCAKNIIVAAPTGVAAINAGGVTLHSLFQLPFHPFLPVKGSKDELLARIRLNRQRQLLLRKMELLVIDEISMVRCDVMDAIDTILRSVRRNYDLPFGGVQLLCIGDLHQLTPVVTKAEWPLLQEYYPSPFFFESKAVREQMPLLIELDTIYRQKEEHFVSLLNKVRNNNMGADDFEDLHRRFNPGFRPPDEEHYITLTTHNNQAELINQRALQQLLAPAYTFNAIIADEFPEHLYPADAALVLKQGAQVMFLKNDPALKRYFNGKIGVISKLEKDKIVVDCDGLMIDVVPETWENLRYTLNRADGKLEQETLGSFTQYPLRLAWAITIHKSQGLTFEKVMIDAGESFGSGQVYVALSRCTSLDGIVLLSKIRPDVIHDNDHVIKAQQSLAHKGSLAERFIGARLIYTHQLMEEIFSFHDLEAAITTLAFHSREQAGKLDSGAIGWVDALKEEIGKYRQIGSQFLGSVYTMLKAEQEIEKNIPLRRRINDAANHFEPKLSAMLQSIQKHSIVTEHKETADIINESLVQLATACYIAKYYMTYCREPFSVTDFLKHKLRLVIPRFTLTCYAGAKQVSYTNIPNQELFDSLKRWRNMVCEETGLAIYMVAAQATLIEIAAFLPLTKNDLLQITGFGKAKVEKYGDQVIETVQDYCSLHNLETNMQALVKKAKKEPAEKKQVTKTDTKAESYNLYREGKNIGEIAKARSLNTVTIEGHLAYYVENGEINIDDLVSKEKQQTIREAIQRLGKDSQKTLKENLSDDISYGDIKLVIANEKIHNLF